MFVKSLTNDLMLMTGNLLGVPVNDGFAFQISDWPYSGNVRQFINVNDLLMTGYRLRFSC